MWAGLRKNKIAGGTVSLLGLSAHNPVSFEGNASISAFFVPTESSTGAASTTSSVNIDESLAATSLSNNNTTTTTAATTTATTTTATTTTTTATQSEPASLTKEFHFFICDVCESRVFEDMREQHADFHVAQRLQDEERSAGQKRHSNADKPTKAKKSKKKSQKGTLTAFFKPKLN